MQRPTKSTNYTFLFEVLKIALIISGVLVFIVLVSLITLPVVSARRVTEKNADADGCKDFELMAGNIKSAKWILLGDRHSAGVVNLILRHFPA